MTGISRKLPDTERHRLKAILKKIVPEDAGVIVRTAAEGASEEELTRDVERLQGAVGDDLGRRPRSPSRRRRLVLRRARPGDPGRPRRLQRGLQHSCVVQGDDAWETVSGYVADVAPDLAERASVHTGDGDLFHDLRVDEQLTKALDRKVWLPSGGSLVIDRTEAMTVIDVNTGKFIGSGGNLEETVTRNNLEAAEEIVRQLRLRDIGGIIVIDFIDMVLESNRDLVLRRLTECLGRDRTKHQVAEVTSLGLVQMTRKRVGEGLLEAFSETCPSLRRPRRASSTPSRSTVRMRQPAQTVRRAAKTGKAQAAAGSRAEPAEPPSRSRARSSAGQPLPRWRRWPRGCTTTRMSSDARGEQPTAGGGGGAAGRRRRSVVPAEPTEPTSAEATEPMRCASRGRRATR